MTTIKQSPVDWERLEALSLLPPTKWREWIDAAYANADDYSRRETLAHIEDDLSAIIEWAAGFSGYIATRRLNGGVATHQGHRQAVKNRNRRNTAARRMLGYTYPQQDLDF